MSIWTDFMGAEVKHYMAGPWKTRAIEAGSGPALVLIHGGGGHAECYAKNVIPLSEHFHDYAILIDTCLRPSSKLPLPVHLTRCLLWTECEGQA